MFLGKSYPQGLCNLARQDRQEGNEGGEPPVWAVGKATIDSRNRVRIPDNIRELVPWVVTAAQSGEPKECILLWGASGGLQLISCDDDVIGRTYKEMEATLSSHRPNAGESDKDWMHLCRLFAAACRTELRFGENYRFYIPAKVKQLGVISREPETELSFLAAGDVLEVWDPDKLADYLQRVAADRSKIYRGSFDEFQKRIPPAED